MTRKRASNGGSCKMGFIPQEQIARLEAKAKARAGASSGAPSPQGSQGEFDRYLTPEQYQAQNVGRGQVLEDLETLRGLQQTGGPAVQEARALQQEQAKGQIALQRGMDTGGRGERMGTEAAAKSYVESQAPVAMIKEAATQGYAREEVGAAGLLAMSDTQFEQAIKGFLGQESDVKKQAGQGKMASVIGGVASGAAAGGTFGGMPGAIFGGLAGGLMGYAAKDGGVVPGVGSEDTFPARLAPGEIVIPKELSAQLMEVMSRSVGGGDVVRAQTGGVVRRDPQTGYLVEDQNAMALQTMALLKEQNERIKELEAKGAYPDWAYSKTGGPGAETERELNRAYLAEVRAGREWPLRSEARGPLIEAGTGRQLDRMEGVDESKDMYEERYDLYPELRVDRPKEYGELLDPENPWLGRALLNPARGPMPMPRSVWERLPRGYSPEAIEAGLGVPYPRQQELAGIERPPAESILSHEAARLAKERGRFEYELPKKKKLKKKKSGKGRK